jgi:hypothetical protein
MLASFPALPDEGNIRKTAIVAPMILDVRSTPR